MSIKAKRVQSSHASLYLDVSELLARFLKEAGFIHVREVSFMQRTDGLLLNDNQDRAWETLYMEAQKSVDMNII